MRVIVLLAFMTNTAGAAILLSLRTETEQALIEDSFVEKLKEGYNLLKNETNAEDTMRLLKQLHGMEDELKDELILPLELYTDSIFMKKVSVSRLI
ncbi:hypothetical protein KIN20_001820 [Parelaphostrongylus tenuis]|uniref:Uncharacterized protein n=1 Tax=Parelaphostrongylus tenuis TaxID=148309 RepID=A0AAD5LWS6_PARTN|nr:hypothetical protein KIN20_001820 [Parelaphostrongylus tenuis]